MQNHFKSMEFQTVVNLLDAIFDEKIYQDLLLKKWIKVYDQSEKNHNVNKEIRIKTSMLRADLCDYSNAYIVVNGTITLGGDADGNETD